MTQRAKWFVLGVVALGCVVASRGFAADPVGVWLFEEGDGADIEDATDGGNTGEIYGTATWSDNGKFGKALSVDGGDGDGGVLFNVDQDPAKSHILHAPADAPDCTLMFYVYTADVPHVAIMWTREDGADSNRYNIYAGPGETFGFDYRDAAGNIHGLLAGLDLFLEQWNHVAITREDNSRYTLYINGEKQGIADDADPSPPDTAAWQICGRPGFALRGMVDELAFFDSVVSEDEIAAIMEQGLEDAVLAVSPQGKAAATWASLKTVR